MNRIDEILTRLIIELPNARVRENVEKWDSEMNLAVQAIEQEIAKREAEAEANGFISGLKWVGLHKAQVSVDDLIETGIEHQTKRLANLKPTGDSNE
jgi:hypothetical protein